MAHGRLVCWLVVVLLRPFSYVYKDITHTIYKQPS